MGLRSVVQQQSLHINDGTASQIYSEFHLLARKNLSISES
jgi:hypothetical protein